MNESSEPAPEPARRRRRRRASAPQGPARPRAGTPDKPTALAPGGSKRDATALGGKREATPPGGSKREATAPGGSKRGNGRSGGKRRRTAREPNDRIGDRGLRDLVGSGRSAVGVDGALRARDVNRPSDDELAAAERDVVIVRRHWQPPTGGGA